MDARLRIFVGGVPYCRCRGCSILGSLSAQKSGVRIKNPKTGQPQPLTGRANASPAHWAVVTIRPGLCVGSDYRLSGDVVVLPAAQLPKPADADPRPSRRGHLPVLDGVRGVAILMVMLLHFVGNVPPVDGIERAIVGVTNYGSYGVELFFVLSGFLITGILYDARNDPHYFRNFYMKRVLRIFPLYYGVLALVFFVAPLIPLLQGATLNYLVERQAWAW